jgi:CRP-like cAMP-binding protein
MSEQVEFLRRVSTFQGLPDSVLERFAALSETRRYSAGDIVFVEMSEGDEIFLVVEGTASVQLALANADEQYEVIKLGPGEIFGEVCFIEKGQRSATVVAETDLETLVWNSGDWRAECEKDFEVGYRLVLAISKLLAARLRRWNLKLLDSALWGF